VSFRIWENTVIARYSILFITPIIFLSGCQARTATQVVEIADTLLKTLNLFLEASKTHQKSVDEAISKAQEGLTTKQAPFIKIPVITSSGEIDLPSVANEWEKHWQDVSTHSKEMQQKLEDVNQASQQYWSKLDEITEQIGNPALKIIEKDKNRLLKSKWNQTYAKANKQVARTIQLNSKADDFHKVIMLSSMRQQLNNQIKQLQIIADEASNVFKEIEAATQQGQDIIGKSKS
jgi:hypothetical protein